MPGQYKHPSNVEIQFSRRYLRNYVSQDIIRRILVDYFGYDVHFVMNVTDIDDKVSARDFDLWPA